MDTVKTGNKLEDQVFAVLANQIAEDCFFAKREYCRIFQKKGYYSRDRGTNIIFDVSVEVLLPGQDHYSLLFLIECKHYNHRVPVDDLEEFFAKIQQVSGANVKGIVVSTNAFQEGALQFAQSKGIGLLRYFTSENVEWILTRSPSSMASAAHTASEWHSARRALRDENYKSRYFDFYGFVNETHTVSSNQFFATLAHNGTASDTIQSLTNVQQATREKRLSVPYKEKQEIEEVSFHILAEIKYKLGEVPLDEICELLNGRYGLVVERNARLDEGVLAQISFGPDEIFIDDSQASALEQIRFALAHEIGHFLLEHCKFMAREACHAEDIDLERLGNMNLKDVQRMEWQANFFASCLLLPKEQVESEFFKQAAQHELVDKGFGLLYLDEQRCNLDTFYRISSPLMSRFHVSRSVVKLRLLKLGFLNEAPGALKNPSQAIRSQSRLLG